MKRTYDLKPFWSFSVQLCPDWWASVFGDLTHQHLALRLPLHPSNNLSC